LKIINDVGDSAILKAYLSKTTNDEWLVVVVGHLDWNSILLQQRNIFSLIHFCTCIIDNVKGSKIRTKCLGKLTELLGTKVVVATPEASLIIRSVAKVIPESDTAGAIKCLLLIIEKDEYFQLVNPQDFIPHILASMRNIPEKSFPVADLANASRALYILSNKSDEAAAMAFDLMGSFDIIQTILRESNVEQFESIRYFFGLYARIIPKLPFASYARTVSLILQKAESYFQLYLMKHSATPEDAELVSFVLDIARILCKQDQGRFLLVEEDILKILHSALLPHFTDYDTLLLKLVIFYKEFSL